MSFIRLLKQVSECVCILHVGVQSEKEKDVIGAVSACSKLFCTLLERKELFRGKLPGEEEALSGEYSLMVLVMMEMLAGLTQALLDLSTIQMFPLLWD